MCTDRERKLSKLYEIWLFLFRLEKKRIFFSLCLDIHLSLREREDNPEFHSLWSQLP